jgi:gas vesicle protein
MSMFEIKCPMCKGTLWVNPSTGEVVDHKSADHHKADLGEFLKTQKDRGSVLEDKFKKAKDEQQKRKQELDSRFKDAAKRAEDFKGDVSSPFDWE